MAFDLFWLLVAADLTTPLNWIVSLLVVGALWRFAHPVGVVMMSTVLSSVIHEAIRTRFSFQYWVEDVFIEKAVENILVFMIIGSVLTTILWLVLRRSRRVSGDST